MAGNERSARVGTAGEPACVDLCASEARYANYFEVGSNHLELIIDCGQFYAGCPAPLMHTRIITSPAYTQRLIDSLVQALATSARDGKPG